ncbi:MAG: Ig-like domain-containing protein [Candidatus Aminicenantes bacterium]|nr:Ig-like domain-containing protein [Acidobacteriota bacterium]MCG2811872.1 Ig-like domain-containing protein [Candidatus Aminicenantes bacterium]
MKNMKKSRLTIIALLLFVGASTGLAFAAGELRVNSAEINGSKIMIVFSEPVSPAALNDNSLYILGDDGRVSREIHLMENNRRLMIRLQTVHHFTLFRPLLLVMTPEIRGVSGNPLRKGLVKAFNLVELAYGRKKPFFEKKIIPVSDDPRIELEVLDLRVFWHKERFRGKGLKIFDPLEKEAWRQMEKCWDDEHGEKERRFGKFEALDHARLHPPQLTVSGVSAGQTANQDVQVHVTASDADDDLRLLQAILDFQEFASGSTIQVQGDHWLFALAADAWHLFDYKFIPFAIEKTALEFISLTPAADFTTREAELIIQGEVKGAATLTINAVEVLLTAGQFQKSFTLNPGANLFKVVAADSAGNQIEKSFTATYIADSEPPQISITTPLSGSFFNSGVIAVSGTVTDRSRIVAVTVNSLPAVVTESQFSLDALTLQEGVNPIIVQAVDEYGNIGKAEIAVTLDTIAPQITVTAPTAGALVNLPGLNINGKAEDANLAKVTAAGTQGQIVGGNFYFESLPLSEGPNDFVIEAEDRAGNQSRQSLTVVLDTLPPQLQITAPAANVMLAAPSVSVSGTVADVHEFSVKVNDIQAVCANGKFSALIPLSQGINRITAVARDQAGNSAAQSVNVNVDSLAPQLNILAPASGSILNSNTVAVSGSFSEANIATITVNGRPATIQDQSFSLAALPLQEGANTIEAVAVDLAGNRNALKISLLVDTAPPTIKAVLPAAGTKLVSVASAIQAEFSEAIAPTSLSHATFYVSRENGEKIAGTLSLEGGKVKFIPAAPLPDSAALTVHIAAAIRDAAGNGLPAPYAGTFYTVDLTPPPPPALQVLPESTSLKRIVLAGSTESNAAIVINGGAAVSQTVAAANGSFSADVLLNANQLNQLLVFAADAAGNQSLPAQTAIYQKSAEFMVLDAAFANNTLSVVFSDSVDPATLNATSFQVSSLQGIEAGTLSAADGTVVFQPEADLSSSAFLLEISTAIADSQGNLLVAPYAKMFNQQGAQTIVQGEVYDDASGLPLYGAVVKLIDVNGSAPAAPVPTALTTREGRYALLLPAETCTLRVEKEGYCRSDRVILSLSGFSATVFDSRLAPQPASEYSLKPEGCAISAAAARDTAIALTLPPGAVAEENKIRISRIADQALQGRLPCGWSPLAVVDLWPAAIAFAAPATLSLPLTQASSLPAAVTLALARWDEQTFKWLAVSVMQVGETPPLQIEAAITACGQYALLVADTVPVVPAAAVAGAALPAVATAVVPDAVTAQLEFSPLEIYPGQSTAGSLTIIPPSPVSSGVAVQAQVSERYELISGTAAQYAPFTADLTAYNHGSGQLRVSFNLSPNQEIALADLKLGSMETDLIRYAASSLGVVVGSDGGSVSGEGGIEVVIEAGAVEQPLAVSLKKTAMENLSLAIPAGFQFLGAIEFSTSGGTLKKSAVLAMELDPAVVAALPADGQFIVCRLSKIDNAYAYVVGQTAFLEMTRIKNHNDAQAILPLGGVRQGGTYVFLHSLAAAGFFKGLVTDKGLPYPDAVVAVSGHDLLSLSLTGGAYAQISFLGNRQLTARNRVSNDLGTAAASLAAAGEVKTQNLAILPTGPTVIGVSPAHQALSVPLESKIVVIFSEAVRATTLNSSNFYISEGSVKLTGTYKLSIDARQGEFVPAQPLPSDKIINVTLSTGIQDLTGNPMTQGFNSTFRTKDIVPPTTDVSLIRKLIPENGFCRIIGAAGAVEPGAMVMVVNDRSGEVVTVSGLSDGSFDLQIAALISDTLLITVKDLAGNEIVVDPGPFTSADGKSAVLDSKACSFITSEGLGLVIEAGTFSAPVMVRVEAETNLQNLAVAPADFSRLQAMKIDFAGAVPLKTYRVSIPAPAGLPVDAKFFVAHEVTVFAEKKLMIVDTCALNNGRIEVNSPPWPGLLKAQSAVLSILITSMSYSMVSGYSPSASAMAAAMDLVYICDTATTANFIFPIRAGADFTLTIRDLTTGEVLFSALKTASAVPGQIYELSENLSNDYECPKLLAVSGLNVASFQWTAARVATATVTVEPVDNNTCRISGPAHAAAPAGKIRIQVYHFDPLSGRETVSGSEFTANQDGSFAISSVAVRFGDKVLIAVEKDNVALDNQFNLAFSESLKDVDMSGLIKLQELVSLKEIPCLVELAAGKTSVTVRPKQSLMEDTRYSLVIRDLRDRNGNALNLVMDFRTGKAVTLDLEETGGAYESILYGRYLIVAAGDQGLKIVDVANPGALATVGVYNAFPGVFSVALYQAADGKTYVLMAGGGSQTMGYLKWIDISDPRQPFQVKSQIISGMVGAETENGLAEGYPRRVKVAGDYAFVAVYGSGLMIVDLKKMTAGSNTTCLVGRFAEEWTNDVEVFVDKTANSDGTVSQVVRAMILIDYFGLKLLNVTNPAAIKTEGSYELPSRDHVQGLELAIDYYCLDKDGDGRVGEKEEADKDDDEDGRFGEDESGDYAFFSLPANNELYILDIGNRAAFDKVGAVVFKDAGGLGDMFFSRTAKKLYICDLEQGVYMLDMRTPAGFYMDNNSDGVDDRIIASIATTVNARFGLAVDETTQILYVGDVQRGIESQKLANPQVKIMVKDNEGKFRDVLFLQPWGLETGDYSPDYPLNKDIYVMAYLPQAAAATGVQVKAELLSLNAGGAPLVPWQQGANAVPTMIAGQSLLLSTDPAAKYGDEGYGLFISQPVRLTVDPEDSNGGIKLLSGDLVQAGLAADLSTVLTYLSESDLQQAVTGKTSIRADLVDSENPEPANNASTGMGETTFFGPGLLDVPAYSGVYLHSGEFFLEETDLAIPGRGFDFVFKRMYKSQSIYSGPLGWNWDHAYNRRLLELPAGDILYFNGQGRRERYVAVKYGDVVSSYTSPEGALTELKKRQDGTFTLIHPDRFIEIFDPQGRLSRLQDRNANKMEFYYDFAGRLSAVQDTMGRLIMFEYYPVTMLDELTMDPKSGRLQSISDFTGRTVTYEYDLHGDLVKAILGEGEEQQNPRGKSYAYSTQEKPTDLKLGHNLKSVTDPEGQIYLSQLTYDGDDKLTSEKIGNSTVAISVDSPTTTTDGEGNARSYSHNEAGNPLTAMEGGHTTKFDYNTDGLVKTVTMPMGNKKEFFYDSGNAERRARGNVLRVVETPDSRGGGTLTTVYTYEPNTNQVISMTDPKGNITTYNRQNAAGNLDSVVAPLNTIYSYFYSQYGQVTQVTDPKGSITSYDYYSEAAPTGNGATSDSGRALDGKEGGYLREVNVDKDGDKISQLFAYDNAGNIVSQIDGEGILAEMVVDHFNQVKSITRGMGEASLSTFYTYDNNGNVETKSESGITETYHHNLANRPIDMTRVGGSLTQLFIYGYDLNFNLRTITYPRGNKDSFEYDERDLLKYKTLGNITKLEYTYDNNGNQTHFTDGESKVWQTDFDGHDRIIRKIDPLQNAITYELDNNSNLTGVSGPENLLISNHYNELNQLRSSTIANNITNGFRYDPAGNMDQYTTPNGHNWNYQASGSGLLKTATDPLSNVGEYGYDMRALPKSVIETESGGRSLSHSMEFNALGNLKNNDDDLQRKWTHHYNSNQLPKDRLDPENGSVGFDYDELNRFKKETRYIAYNGFSVPAASEYEYDLNDNVVSAKDANGNKTVYHYDDKERLREIIYPDNRLESYEYDKNDRLAVFTDANGTVVSNIYDLAGRLTDRTVTLAAGVEGPTHEQFAYDGLNRLVRAENENTITSLVYDNAGRLTKETQQTKNGAVITGTYEVNNGYDNNSNKTSLTYPSGKALSITPDALDRIASIQAGGNPIAAYTYEGPDKVKSKTLGLSLKLEAEFDDGKRPTALKYVNALTSKDIIDQAMSWNKVDLKTGETRADAANQSKNYEYDSAYRLRKTAAAQNETEYDIDGTDNIKQVKEVKEGVSQTINHDVNNRNQVTTLDNRTLTYDNNGNLISFSSSSMPQAQKFVYDYRNQLVRVENGGTQVEFMYDALGRRVQKKAVYPGSSATTKYVYDGNQVIEERDGANVLKSRYAYGNGIDEPVEIEKENAGAMKSYLPMQDTNGNIIALADNTGKLIEKVNYSSYGAPTFIYDHVAPQVDQVRVVSGKINIRFSEAVDQDKAKTAIKVKEGTNSISGSFVFEEEGKLAVFTPSSALQTNIQYGLEITTDLEDISGNKLASVFNEVFLYPGTDIIVFDRIAPEVELIKLVSGKIYVAFSEELDPASIANAIGLIYSTGTINGTSTLEDAKTILFTPANTLSNKTEYTISVKSSIKDLSGKVLSVFSEKFIYSGSDLLIYKKLDPTEHTESYVKNTTLFQGRAFDPETGLYYFRARYLQPELGRFLQGDPKGYFDSMNPYQAMGNNPVNFSDPMGEAVKSGVLPEVAESAYRQFIASGDSPDTALNKLVQYGYIDNETSYKFALAFSSKINEYKEALTNTAENVSEKVGISKGFRKQMGRLAKGELKEFWKQGLVNLENISKDPFFGVQLALGISGGIKSEGPKTWNEFQSATKGMFRSRTKAGEVFRSFERDTIKIERAGPNKFGLRFHDYGKTASPKGGYLFETFTQETNRANMAIPYEWNGMTGIKQWQVKEGSFIITGRAASQFKYGSQYVGGARQWYIPNYLNNLLEVK